MSCRIDRVVSGEDVVVFRLSGRIDAEYVDTLRELVERERGRVAIDLKEVVLVDREAVRLLPSAKSTESNSETVRLMYVSGFLERGLALVTNHQARKQQQEMISTIFDPDSGCVRAGHG